MVNNFILLTKKLFHGNKNDNERVPDTKKIIGNKNDGKEILYVINLTSNPPREKSPPTRKPRPPPAPPLRKVAAEQYRKRERQRDRPLLLRGEVPGPENFKVDQRGSGPRGVRSVRARQRRGPEAQREPAGDGRGVQLRQFARVPLRGEQPG